MPVDPYKAPDAEIDSPYADALLGEAVLAVPSHSERWVAAFLDSMIIIPGMLVVFGGVGTLTVVLELDPDSGIASSLIGLAQLAVLGFQILYGAVFESSGWHATPGKKMMGLAVTSQHGDCLSFPAALGRNVAKIIGLSMCGLLALSVFFDDQARGVWDRVATSRVVARNPNAWERSVDPYSPPEVDVAAVPMGLDADGIHRDGKVLVVPRDGAHALPSVCIKCGEQSADPPLLRKLSWHPRWVIFLLLLNVIFFAIGAALTRQTMQVAIPMCDEHQRGRRTKLFAGLGVMVGCWGVAVAAVVVLDDDVGVLLAMLGAIIGFVGMIVALVVLSPLRPMRIDDKGGRFAGAKPAFLDQLPGA